MSDHVEIDYLLSLMGKLVPTGAVLDFGGSAAPAGWLVCDGSAVSRTTYSTLFGVIGTTFGAGDGSTTFNLPDARGRATYGVGSVGTNAQPTLALGATGGSIANLVTHTHTQPSHTHTDSGHGHGASGSQSAHSHTIGGAAYQFCTDPVQGYFNGGSGYGYQTGNYFSNTDNSQPSVSVSVGSGNAQITGTTPTINNAGTGTTAPQPYLALNKIIKT